MNNQHQRQAPLQLDTVREVSARERNTDSLQDLPPRFWEDAQEYIDVLTDRLEDATSETTDAPEVPREVARLREERKSALKVLESLADNRKAKVVKRARLAAKDLPAETDAMTGREEELFETVRDEFQAAQLAPSLTAADDGEAEDDEEAAAWEVVE